MKARHSDRRDRSRPEGPKGLPKDGLRAGCGKFRARSSYRGGYYLDCGGHKLKANTRSSRDTFYAVYCCRDWERCPFRD